VASGNIGDDRRVAQLDRPTSRRDLMGAATKTVTDATFDAEVLGSDVPVIVDFWAEWCGPCKMVAPVLEEIAAENEGKVVVVKLNTDENPEITRRYQVMSIPTMSVFSGGEVVKSIVGAKPKAALLRDLEGYL
jgi:thioredoxin 1